MRYEFKIKILNKKYIDTLIVSLARQGYAPYITDDSDVCIEIADDELIKLTHK